MQNKFILLAASLALMPTLSSADIISAGNEKTGVFTVSGYVELDINYLDNSISNSGVTDEKSQFNQDGEVLVQFAGKKAFNQHYVRFVAQPLFNSTGAVTLDDSYIELGQENNWTLKVGRYEAYDMYPRPQDVLVEYDDDTSEDLYQDNVAYSYRVIEAKGRGNDGQILISKTLGNLYLELGTILGDRISLFTNTDGTHTYHGNLLNDAKDTIVARPVVAYKVGDFELAVAAEKNLIKDAITYTDKMGNSFDVLERDGFGTRISFDRDMLNINAMYTYLNALNEINQTLGLTGIWNNTVALGVTYSFNRYDDPNFRVGKTNFTTVYGSYSFNNVMHIEDFSIQLGAFYSDLDNDLDGQFVVNQTNSPINAGGNGGGSIQFYYTF